MREPRLRRDFERFRERGDTAALGRVFDRTAGELFRVANHLVRDPVEAEDLLQATFLTAIERADSFEASRPLEPWLFGILAKQAAAARRRARREVDPERVARTPPGDPSEEAAERELSAEFERALENLPRKYRDVLDPFLRDGRPAAEIARDLGLAPGTVRMQVHRGLGLLRKSLPAGLAGSALIASAPRGLAAVRESVMAQASTAAAAGSAAPAATLAASKTLWLGSTLGSLAMAKAIGVAAVVAALGAGALWTWSSRGDERAPAQLAPGAGAEFADSRGGLPAGGGVAGDEVAVAAREDAATERAQAAAPDGREEPAQELSAGRGGLSGRVVHGADRAPAGDVGLLLLDGSMPDAWLRVVEFRTDDDGTFRLPDLDPGRYAVEFDRALASTNVDVRAGEFTDVELELPAGVDVAGRVVDENGRGLAGAELWLAGPDYRLEARRVGRADERGGFLLRALDRDRFLGARSPGHAPAEFVEVRTLPDTGGRSEGRRRAQAEFVLRAGAGTVVGTVTDPDGEPVEGAFVRVGTRSKSARLSTGGLSVSGPPPLEVRTDGSGRFEASGIGPGRAQVAVRAPDHPEWRGEVLVLAGRRTRTDARLVRGATVSGRVLDADGLPAHRAVVHMPEPGYFRRLAAGVDRDGRYTLRDVPPGTVRLRAELFPGARGGEALAVDGTLTVRPGEQITWDAQLVAGPAIRGVALDERGRALAGVEVRALQMEPFAKLAALVYTDAEGRFELSGLLDMTYHVEVHGRHGSMQLARASGVRPGDPALTLRLDPERVPSATVTGVVLDPTGQPAQGRVLIDAKGRTGQLHTELDPEGGFELHPIPPGDYRVSVWPDGWARESREVDALAAHEERSLGTIQLEEPGSVVLQLRRDDGGPLDAVQVSAGRLGSSPVFGTIDVDGRVAFERLGAGEHYVEVSGPSVRYARRSFVLEGGASLELEIVLSSGARQEFRVHVPAHLPPVEYLSVRVNDSAGHLAAFQSLWKEGGSRLFTFEQALPPGTYELVLTGDSGSGATLPVEFGDAPGPVVELALTP